MEDLSLIVTEDSTLYQSSIQNYSSEEGCNIVAPSDYYREELFEKNNIWYKAIYEKDKLKSLITLSDDKTTYVQEVVFHDDGVTQKMIIPYVNGVREGVVYAFHKNGRVKLIVPIRNGKKEGNRREYNESGVLIEECYYVANKKNGGYRRIDPHTGRCLIQAFYRNGCLEGDKKFFDAQGNLIAIEKFLSGERISVDVFNPISSKFEGFRIL